jgi:predicted  nucleic acid-binding Zn-ribbon protein
MGKADNAKLCQKLEKFLDNQERMEEKIDSIRWTLDNGLRSLQRDITTAMKGIRQIQQELQQQSEKLSQQLLELQEEQQQQHQQPELLLGQQGHQGLRGWQKQQKLQTQSYLTTDGQSASLSWYQAIIRGIRAIILSFQW